MSLELTYSDVAEHNTKNDLYMVIHDKIYDVSKFLDEHPGGEEVLLDVAGQDATEAFEDVGHSDEARELLNPLLVGKLKRQPGDPVHGHTSSQASGNTAEATGFGLGMYAVVLIGGVGAFFAYQYAQQEGLL